MTYATALRIEPGATVDTMLDQSRCAVEAGFHGIEALASDPALSLDAAISDLPDASNSDGIAPVVSVSASIGATEISAARAELVSLLEHASAARARCLNVTMPPVARAPVDQNNSTGYRDAVNFAYQLLRRCRLDAEAADVAIGLEAAAGGCFASPVELRELVDAVNSWSVGISLDVQHLGGFAALSDWATTLSHRVHAVRLYESILPPSQESKACDTDAERMRFAGVLHEIGYDRLMVVAGNGTPKELRKRLTRLYGPVSNAQAV